MPTKILTDGIYLGASSRWNLKKQLVVWLNVIIKSEMCFRVNVHSIFAWMSKNSGVLLNSVQEFIKIQLKYVLYIPFQILIKNANVWIKAFIK